MPHPEMSDSQRLIHIETLIEGMVASDSDHEIRLRRLERILYIGIGLAAAGGSAIGSFLGNMPAS